MQKKKKKKDLKVLQVCKDTNSPIAKVTVREKKYQAGVLTIPGANACCKASLNDQ